MNVKLSKSQITAIQAAAEDIKADCGKVAKSMSATPDTGLSSNFLTYDAVRAATKRFGEKADWAGRRWDYFAAAVEATAAGISKTDDDNAAKLPKFELPRPKTGQQADY